MLRDSNEFRISGFSLFEAQQGFIQVVIDVQAVAGWPLNELTPHVLCLLRLKRSKPKRKHVLGSSRGLPAYRLSPQPALVALDAVFNIINQ